MRAFGIREVISAGNMGDFVEFDAERPELGARDILVKIRAVALNPVDAKVRASLPQNRSEPRILGWDASGVVHAVGAEVTRFSPGDEVFYAGDVTRAGCNAEWHCVDERIVARKPRSLDFAQAASMPLTSLTAWEGLNEKMRIAEGQRILIIGGAGGVGSIAIQIAKMRGLHVTATASREESRQWCLAMGADAILDHSLCLSSQCAALQIAPFDGIANFSNTERYWDFMGEWIAPMGQFLLIVEPQCQLRIGDPLKAKCVSIHWEFMFARSKFATTCMAEQGEILRQIAALVDAGALRHTMASDPLQISVEELEAKHSLMRAGSAIGKHVLYFSS